MFIHTVNDEQQMMELAEAGASGLFTDYPQHLLKVLEECRLVE